MFMKSIKNNELCTVLATLKILPFISFCRIEGLPIFSFMGRNGNDKHHTFCRYLGVERAVLQRHKGINCLYLFLYILGSFNSA
jgi:hypothetical protein